MNFTGEAKMNAGNYSSDKPSWGDVTMTVRVLLLSLLLTVAIGQSPSHQAVAAPESTGRVTQPLTGGGNDANTPTANVVVGLSTGSQMSGGRCTGTLLTPTMVLTARHCITGTFGRFQRPVTGMGRRPLVWVGAQVGTLKQFTSVRSLVFGDPLSGPVAPDGPNTTPRNIGNDLAVVFLDPRNPVLEEAVIPRITFAAPVLGGRDVNGGSYAPLPGSRYGMAGWSPTGGAAARQVAYFPDRISIHHYPDMGGQIWVRQLSGAVTYPGDSGSPIFIERSNGQREVFGVLFGRKSFGWDWGQGWDDIDCSNDCAVYVDITRGAPRDWLMSVVRDTSRSGAWLQKHGRSDMWWGEVDYTGPCQAARDADCDHWFDEHDDCPRLFNPEQREDDPCALHVFYQGPDGALATNWAVGPWQRPFPITPPGAARPNTPIAIVTRWNQLHIFYIRSDGAVATTWSDGRPWVPPFAITPPGAARGDSPLAAVVRGGDQLHVFYIGPDGALATNWAVGPWQRPFPITPPGAAGPGSRIEAVVRADQLHVFYQGADGALATNWAIGPWQQPFPITPPGAARPNTPIAIVLRGAVLNAFYIGPDGALATTWSADRPWVPPFPITPPGAARGDSPLAAVVRGGDQLHVFYIGPDGALATNWAVGPWQRPFPITPPGAAGPGSWLGAALRRDQLHVFYQGADGALATNWAVGPWQQPFPITPPGAARPNSSLAVVSR